MTMRTAASPVTTTWASSQGWDLVMTQETDASRQVTGTGYELRGLEVTAAQARELARCRTRGMMLVTVTAGRLTACIGLSLEEYMAILALEPPLSVLLPRLRARPLTLEEMLAG